MQFKIDNGCLMFILFNSAILWQCAIGGGQQIKRENK
jgi:hypothetical protein